MGENQIVVYQPDETLRLDVRLENETVWLTQEQMCELFQRDRTVITKHVRNVFNECECDEENNVQILHINHRGRPMAFYSLDVIISVGYRVKSMRGTLFRRWANQVLKSYFLHGQSLNQHLYFLEDKIDRNLAKHEERILSLENKVDFFIKTKEPPLQGVFYDGQLWDACSLVEGLIARAQSTILLIDSWIGVGTLDMLAKKRDGVDVNLVTSPHGNQLAASDIAKFNAQYPTLTVKTSTSFHDRFLIVDDKELYLVGASLKDLGRKCFGFTRMDAGEIANLKARI